MTAGALAGIATQTAVLENRKNDNANGAASTAPGANPDLGNRAGRAKRLFGDAVEMRLGAARMLPPDGRDVVSLSGSVPRPFGAGTLDGAGAVAEKLLANLPLKRQENQELNEDNIYRAVVAMRLYQKNGGSVPQDVWVSGLQKPTRAEMQEAYRRLTQRVVAVDTVNDPAPARQMRLDILDAFRGFDWNSSLFATRETASVA